MSSIDLPEELKVRLMEAARRRGFLVERGQSQLADYLEYLLGLDERTGPVTRSSTLHQALGLLAGAGDSEVERLLDERRMRK